MKILSLIILSLLAFSCQDKRTSNTSRTLHLINKIGVITIDLTADFDTLHSWKRSSDYRCGDKAYYRFQSTSYSMAEEKDYISEEPDSMYCLTITHVLYPDCNNDEIKFEPYKSLNRKKEGLLQINPSIRFNKFEVATINSLEFAIIGYKDTIYSNKIVANNLYAITFYNNYYIEFHFLKSSLNNNDSKFINNSYKMLQTLRINQSY